MLRFYTYYHLPAWLMAKNIAFIYTRFLRRRRRREATMIKHSFTKRNRKFAGHYVHAIFCVIRVQKTCQLWKENARTVWGTHYPPVDAITPIVWLVFASSLTVGTIAVPSSGKHTFHIVWCPTVINANCRHSMDEPPDNLDFCFQWTLTFNWLKHTTER